MFDEIIFLRLWYRSSMNVELMVINSENLTAFLVSTKQKSEPFISKGQVWFHLVSSFAGND